MTHAMRTVCGWVASEFSGETIFLRVFADNSSAVRLYERCGFTEVKRWPVHWLESGGEGSWAENNPESDPSREVILMDGSRAGGL
jgi:RimJ/RimL family protein N-acetyltransferase